jgi:pimeloyl-ACP methyl ester carboxylesterase
MDRVRHGGRTTAYETHDRGGDGTGLLCIHGSGGTRDLWAGQRRLATDRPVVTVDLSGHGDSEDVDAEPGYETLSAYVDDVVAVLEATDARVLVGSSLGGAVALRLAIDRDVDLAGLILAGTGARLAVLSDLLGWLDDDFDRAVEWLHEPDRLFHDADDATIAASREAMVATGRETTRRDFRTCHGFDVRDRVAEVAVPALAVVGEHDRLTPRHYHEFLADELPACELATVADAAHLAMLEAAPAFDAVVTDFCERVVD